MGFWFYMLFMCLLIPAIMLFFGIRFSKQAPKDINNIYGYRTSRSMKSKEAWEFAHKYIGRIWFICGLVLLPLSVIPMLFVIGKGNDTVGNIGTAIVLVQLIPLIVSIFPTEAALKNNFDNNERKNKRP